jgi:hypothetical protein
MFAFIQLCLNFLFFNRIPLEPICYTVTIGFGKAERCKLQCWHKKAGKNVTH